MKITNHSCGNSLKVIGAGLTVCLVCGNVVLSALPNHDNQFALDKVAPHGFEEAQPLNVGMLQTISYATSGTATPMRQPYQGMQNFLGTIKI